MELADDQKRSAVCDSPAQSAGALPWRGWPGVSTVSQQRQCVDGALERPEGPAKLQRLRRHRGARDGRLFQLCGVE